MSQPRVVVLGHNKGRWTYSDRIHEAAVTSGIEAWVFALNGHHIDHKSVRTSDLSMYDVIICNTNFPLQNSYTERYLRLQDSLSKEQQWVSLLEGEMLEYLRPSQYLRQIFDNSTFVNCINRHTVEFIQSLTTAPVFFLGIPYPADGIRRFYKSLSERQQRIHLCSFLGSRWNDYHVAKHFEMQMIGFEKQLIRNLPNVFSNWKTNKTVLNKYSNLDKARRLYNDSNIEILPNAGFTEYYSLVGDTYLWVNLDQRYTWARYVLDAAALGVPIITTQSTGHGPNLFPDTTVNSAFDTNKAIDIGRKLITDKEFYQHVSESSFYGLREFAPERMKDRFLHYLKR